MKAEPDNSNFNFSQLCDDVSFAGGPVSVIPWAPIWLSTGLVMMNVTEMMTVVWHAWQLVVTEQE